MKRIIIGGVITAIIGGTGYTISQKDVVNNFADNTGMSQEQAQQYVNSSQNDLQSFTKVGGDLTSDGNSILDTASKIDCVNYTYKWVTSAMSCEEGDNELRTIGNNEITMGNCYAALGTDLGSAGQSKINECIDDIDSLDASYDLPIASSFMDSSQVSSIKNSNLYNKSVLQAASNSQ